MDYYHQERGYKYSYLMYGSCSANHLLANIHDYVIKQSNKTDISLV